MNTGFFAFVASRYLRENPPSSVHCQHVIKCVHVTDGICFSRKQCSFLSFISLFYDEAEEASSLALRNILGFKKRDQTSRALNASRSLF